MGIWIATMAATLGVTGIAAYVQFAPASEVPKELRRQEPEDKPSPAQPPRPQMQSVSIAVPRIEGDDVVFDVKPLQVPGAKDPYVVAFQSFLSQSNIAPTEARLLSVSVEDGHAVLSFNEAFRAGYGSMEESMLLRGLLRTAGLFPQVSSVEILVDGQPLGSLGHLEVPARVPVIRESEPSDTLPIEGPEPP